MPKNKNKQHRKFIYERDNFSCVYCGLVFNVPNDWNGVSALHNGEMFLELDHVKPLSKKGTDLISNKQCLCQKCNNIKSNKYD